MIDERGPNTWVVKKEKNKHSRKVVTTDVGR